MEDTVSIVILNHGRYGEELIRSAEMIVGKIDQIQAISLLKEMSIEEYYGEVKKVMSAICGQVIVVTDLYGGTPSNVAMMLQQEFVVKIVCGVNLPMLLELVLSRNTSKDIDELVTSILEVAKKSICQPKQIVIVDDD